MQLEHRASKVFITGVSGCGKSTFWTNYVKGADARIRFVFDHEGELQARLKFRAALRMEELGAAVQTGWCVFDPSLMFPGRTQEAFAFFCDFAFQLSSRLPGKKLFACDELQKLVGTNRITPEFASVLETGRRWGLDAVMIAQQPNLVHNRVRNQMTEVVAFQQRDESAYGILVKDWGFQEAELKGLRPGQFICRSSAGGESRGRVF